MNPLIDHVVIVLLLFLVLVANAKPISNLDGSKPAGHRVIVRFNDASGTLSQKAAALEAKPGVHRVKALHQLGMAVVDCGSSDIQEGLLKDLENNDDVELAVPDTWLSADASDPVTSPWKNPELTQCSANPACHARHLDVGDCCPTPDGTMLSCCEAKDPAQVALRTFHGNLISADAWGGVSATSTEASASTVFSVISLDDGDNVTLRSHDGKFVTVQEFGGFVTATATSINDAEIFEISKGENGTITLKSHFGKYLVAEWDGAIYANRPDASTWESFEMIEVAGPGQRLPDDPSLAKLWGMHHWSGYDIDAAEAWKTATGEVGAGIIVGVIDTGIDYRHEDLREQMWHNPGEIPDNGIDDDNNGYIDDVHGADFVNEDGDPWDDQMHGTHCSGTIAGVGNNDVGVSGVAWRGVKLMALKFLSASGSGATSDAIKAVDYAVAHGAKVLSNSWGGGGSSSAMRVAIERAEAAGLLFVAAAGNEGSDNDEMPHYPSNYEVDSIISVASTTVHGHLSGFSCYGNDTVHVAAPGSNIFSTVPGSEYKSLSGTSMATPHVSGLAALVWMYRPQLSMQQVKDIILNSVKPLPALDGMVLTGGLINAKNALETAWAFQPPQPPVHAPTGIAFEDIDPKVGAFAGTVTISAAADESDIEYYRVYMMSGAGFQMQALGEEIPKTGEAELYLETNGSFVPSRYAKSLAVVAGNSKGEQPVHTLAGSAVHVELEDFGVPEMEPKFVRWSGDSDLREGPVKGSVIIGRARDEMSITEYNLYWRDRDGVRGAKLGSVAANGYVEPKCTGSACGVIVSAETSEGAYHFERGPYGNDETANIKVSGPGKVTVTRFHSEEYYDFLSIGSTKLTGAPDVPLEIPMEEGPVTISWASDASVTGDGWSLDVVQTGAEIRFDVAVDELPAHGVEVVPAFKGNELPEGVFAEMEDYDTSMPPSPFYAPARLLFTDMDPVVGTISGVATLMPAAAIDGGVEFYRLNFATVNGDPVAGEGWTVQADGNKTLDVTIPAMPVPANAVKLMARAGNSHGLGDRATFSDAKLFDVEPMAPSNVTLRERDSPNDTISGELVVEAAESEAGIVAYAAYWYDDVQKIGEIARASCAGYGTETVIKIPPGSPRNASAILVVSVYAWGEMKDGFAIDVEQSNARRLGAREEEAPPVMQPWIKAKKPAAVVEWTADREEEVLEETGSNRVRCSVNLPVQASQASKPEVRSIVSRALSASLPGAPPPAVRVLRVRTTRADASAPPTTTLDLEVRSTAVSADRIEARLILLGQGGRAAQRFEAAVVGQIEAAGFELSDQQLRVGEPQQLAARKASAAGRQLEGAGPALDTLAEEVAEEETAGAAMLAMVAAAAVAALVVGAAAAYTLRRRLGERPRSQASAARTSNEAMQRQPLQNVSVQAEATASVVE